MHNNMKQNLHAHKQNSGIISKNFSQFLAAFRCEIRCPPSESPSYVPVALLVVQDVRARGL
jgi:hypothetical protein